MADVEPAGHTVLHYSSPEYVLAGLVAVYAYIKLLKRCGRGGGRPPSLWCHWFLWMYLFLCYLLLSALRSAVKDVLLVSRFLDPGRTAEVVRGVMEADGELGSLPDWEHTASLEGNELLRWLSMLSPVWVVATFGVCLYHTGRHVQQMRLYAGSGPEYAERFKLHEKTIRVLFLPLIYGLMSFHAVIFTWCIVVNHRNERHPFHSWLARVEFFSEMFEAAFGVADIYEAYALLILGHIIMQVLRTKMEALVDRKEDEEEAMHVDRLHSEGSKAALRPAPTISAEMLMAEMKELTTFGIKLFCWTCFLQAVYHVLATTLGYHHVMDGLFGRRSEHGKEERGILQTPAVQIRSRFFFLGAGFVASFAAIGNIVKVEQAFHAHLSEFGPFWKFWGTKVIVSIAFIQSVGLKFVPPFCWWSATRVNLFYASMLCLECFLVSLLHLHAWAHDQRWYVCLRPLATPAGHSGSSSGEADGAEDDSEGEG